MIDTQHWVETEIMAVDIDSAIVDLLAITILF
jgi:hypothetical protein